MKVNIIFIESYEYRVFAPISFKITDYKIYKIPKKHLIISI
jgi:hypothetical protein